MTQIRKPKDYETYSKEGEDAGKNIIQESKGVLKNENIDVVIEIKNEIEEVKIN